jgi:hypothetical protein
LRRKNLDRVTLTINQLAIRLLERAMVHDA